MLLLSLFHHCARGVSLMIEKARHWRRAGLESLESELKARQRDRIDD